MWTKYGMLFKVNYYALNINSGSVFVEISRNIPPFYKLGYHCKLIIFLRNDVPAQCDSVLLTIFIDDAELVANQSLVHPRNS